MSQTKNLGLCNQCKGRVPADFHFADGKVWIRKDCPTCGATESLVSSDADAWKNKRHMWNYVPTDRVACSLNCDKCKIDHHPNMVFIDVTNRCNMHCPICIATIRGMGFDFNPPVAYFDKLFGEIAKMNPKPVIQLFGGEPTVREDLLEIIATARRHGLKPHVVTNGLRLADEEYCKKLCEARVPLRFGFDGRSEEIYARMRQNPGAYHKKMKALENLRKYSRRKHAIIATAAWGINDKYMPDFFAFLHENRDLVGDVGIIPLTENWEEGEFEHGLHSTMEDVEKMVAQSLPEDPIEFVPAGLSYAMRKPRSFFRDNPRSEVLLLAGVHPNCESMTLLISDGQKYRSINHYLKKPFSKVAVEFAEMSRKLEPRLDKLDPKKFFQRLRGQLLVLRTFTPWAFRSVRFGRLIGNPFTALGRLVAGRLFRKKSEHGQFRSRRPRRVLRVAMLPFEEQHSVDAARMENCKAVFAYEDTADGEVKYISACLWYPYRNPILENLSHKYGIARRDGTVRKLDAAATAEASADAEDIAPAVPPATPKNDAAPAAGAE